MLIPGRAHLAILLSLLISIRIVDQGLLEDLITRGIAGGWFAVHRFRRHDACSPYGARPIQIRVFGSLPDSLGELTAGTFLELCGAEV